MIGCRGPGPIAAALLATACAAGAEAPPVPVHEVEPGHFTRRTTAEGNLRAVKATQVSPPRSPGRPNIMKIEWLAPDGAEVAEGDVVVRFDPTELERQLEQSRADLAAAEARLRKERANAHAAEAGRERTATLAALELEETRRFQQKDEEIFSRHQIIESAIDEELSQAKMAHAREAKQIEKGLTRSTLELLDVGRRQARLAIEQAEAGLAQLEVRAPHAGILVYRRDHTGSTPEVGDQVWPGQVLAELPLLDDMEAEVFVLEVDGGGLSEGIPAAVVVEASPEVEYAATVKRVDKLAKPRFQHLPVQYFAVTLELEQTDREVMKPGQRVRATLVMDREDALVVPRQAIFEVDERSVVYRRDRAGRFEPVEVVVGAGTPGRVVIESGLAAGDRIALRDPRFSAHEPAGAEGAGAGGGGAEGAGGGR